jgi:hypothetical protein
MFYKKPINGFYDEAYTLYAFTNNKKIYEKFRKERNMDKFIIHKKKIDKDELYKFRKMYDRFELHQSQFHTRTEFGKFRTVKIICTFIEEETVILHADKIWNEYKNILFDAKVFNSDYIKALEKICFITFYIYQNGLDDLNDYFYTPYYNAYGTPSELIREIEQTPYEYDEFAVFLKFFKDTFIE